MVGKPYYGSDAPGYALGDYPSVKRRFDNDSSSRKQGPPKKEKCFIASVVYGGSDVEQVRVLREYRDNVLMQDDFGRKFVDWYYNGGGERMAEFVRGKGKFLIPVIRKGLDFIVEDYTRRIKER